MQRLVILKDPRILVQALFNTASFAAPRIPLYREDAGIEPRLQRLL
jgi:hypothetical protein